MTRDELYASLHRPGYVKPTTKPPSHPTMAKWLDEGWCKATDGCRVEPDGTCEHGHQSWL